MQISPGRKNMCDNKKYLFHFMIVLVSLLISANCWAGNLSLIEKRLKELDALNKQAVKQATEIPKNGVIQATLKIPSGNNIEKLTVQKLSISPFGSNSPFTIQVSSSPQRDRILAVARQLRQAGVPAFISTPFQHEGKSWWRIFIGSYATKMEAEKANENFHKKMFPKGFIINLTYAIQIGNEVTEHDAALMDKELQALAYLPYISPGSQKGYVRVLLGAFQTELEAEAAAANLKNINIALSIVQR
jgi:cell division septation protein DedD